MSGLTKAYTLKEGSIAPTTTYLGADVQQHTFKDAIDQSQGGQCLLTHTSKEQFCRC
jgi:hypothetical protein